MGVSNDWRVPAGKFLMGSREGGFQSISVTKDWRQISCFNGNAPLRRRFQSIGVTKDWRRVCVEDKGFYLQLFPINRRHQGLATVFLGGMDPNLTIQVSNQ